MSDEVIDVLDEEAAVKVDNSFPHTGYDLYFEKLPEKHKNESMFYAQCKICVKKKRLSISCTSAGNLKKHLQVCTQLYQ